MCFSVLCREVWNFMSWHGRVLVWTPCCTIGEVRRRPHLPSPRRHHSTLHPPKCGPWIPTTQGVGATLSLIPAAGGQRALPVAKQPLDGEPLGDTAGTQCGTVYQLTADSGRGVWGERNPAAWPV